MTEPLDRDAVAKALAERFERFMTAPSPKAPVIPLAAAKGGISTPEEMADRLAEFVAAGVPATLQIGMPDRETAKAVFDHLIERGDQRLIDIWFTAILQADAREARAEMRATMGDDKYNALLAKVERDRKADEKADRKWTREFNKAVKEDRLAEFLDNQRTK